MIELEDLGDDLRLYKGDCRRLIASLPDNSVDAVVTDPPYEIGFMNRGFDRTGIAFDVDLWRGILRVLKPGGHVAAFAASRTYHRLAGAIEDAGFEIRDQVDWVYASGMPHGSDAAILIDRERREDLEPTRRVCRFIRAAMDAKGLASKDLASAFDCNPRLIDHWAARDTDSQPSLPSVAQWSRLKTLLDLDDAMDGEVERLNVRKGQPSDTFKQLPVIGEHASETGGVPGERFQAHDNLIREPSDTAKPFKGWYSQLKPAHEPICLARKPLDGNLAHNLFEYGTGALHIDACRVPFRNTADEAESKGKNQHGRFGSGPRDNHVYGADKADRTDYTAEARFAPNMLFDQSTAKELDRQSGIAVSRKGKPRASTKPGDGWGMTHTGAEYDDMGGASRFYPVFRYCPKASPSERPKVDGILHPTVKPVELMRWLVRLITPEGGLVLEPFAGSGTTLEACLLEHMQCTASELDPDYIKLIHARLSKPIQNELF